MVLSHKFRPVALMGAVSFLLLLTACGSPQGATGPRADLTVTKLSSITNYAFTYEVSSTSQMSGQFHSLTDYQIDLGGIEERYVKGQEYVSLDGTTWTTSVGTTMDPMAQVAAQMVGMLSVKGIRISSGGPCTVAGQKGRKISLRVPRAGRVGHNQTYDLCVDTANGGLLQGTVTASATIGQGPSAITEDFVVTQVGGVPVIAAPAATAATPSD